MNPPSTPLSPVLRDAAAVGTAWLTSGCVGCSVAGPDGQRLPLAGESDAPPSASAPMRGRMRGWTLDVHGGTPDADRLAVDARLLSTLTDRATELDHTTSALIDANEQLLAIYGLASSSADTTEDRDLILELTQDACRLTQSQAALVVLKDGLEAAHGDDEIVTLLRTHLGDAGGQVHRADDTGDAAFDIVSRPLHGESDGQILLAAERGHRFTTADLQRIDAVTHFLSGLISLEVLHRAAIQSAVIERDATTAAELARMILPTGRPDIAGIELAARCDPARMAAGDFYTWTGTPDGIVFAVGDVSGKGLPAALVMTMVTRATIRAALTNPGADPTALFTILANELTDYLSEAGVFVTMVIGIYCPGDDVIRLANAGHSPVISRIGGQTASVGATAPPLGVLADLVPTTETFAFAASDTIMIGTDGLAEQEDEHGVQMGYDILNELVEAHADHGAEALVGALFEAVEQITIDGQQDDDRTALVIHRTGTAKEQAA